MDKCHHSAKQSRHRSPRARLLIGRINLSLLKPSKELKMCCQDKWIIQDSKKLENGFTSFYPKVSLKNKIINEWKVQVGWQNTRLVMLSLLVYTNSGLVSCFGSWNNDLGTFSPLVTSMMESISNKISKLTQRDKSKKKYLSVAKISFIDEG